MNYVRKVKAAIAKVGTGPEARVKLTLRDKTKLKGYVSEAREQSFLMFDDTTGTTIEVLYFEVDKMKGHKLHPGKAASYAAIWGIISVFVVMFALH